MEPNDLPILCLPMDLSDESAASLIEFLYQLTEALERHYAGAASAPCAPVRAGIIAAGLSDHRSALLTGAWTAPRTPPLGYPLRIRASPP
jgi:hypothetical protein